MPLSQIWIKFFSLFLLLLLLNRSSGKWQRKLLSFGVFVDSSYSSAPAIIKSNAFAAMSSQWNEMQIKICNFVLSFIAISMCSFYHYHQPIVSQREKWTFIKNIDSLNLIVEWKTETKAVEASLTFILRRYLKISILLLFYIYISLIDIQVIGFKEKFLFSLSLWR